MSPPDVNSNYIVIGLVVTSKIVMTTTSEALSAQFTLVHKSLQGNIVTAFTLIL